MAKVMTFDFRGAPPVQGGGSDRVPPARYLLTINRATSAPSSTGKPMISIAFKITRGGDGKQNGKRLRDQFVFPAAKGDQVFGKQRFNGMLGACGVKAKQDGPWKFDIDTLVNKQVWAEVGDNIIPGDGKRPERVTSQPQEYLLPAQVKAMAKAAEADDEDEDEEDEDDEDTEDDEDDEEDDTDDELEDDEDEEDDEEEEEEEEPAPPRRRAARAAAAPAAPARRRTATAAAAPARRTPRRTRAAADDDEFPFQ